MNFLKAMFGNYSKREVKRVQPICDKVLALEDKYAAMSESELKNQTTILKERLANGETTDDILPEAFATCREVCREGSNQGFTFTCFHLGDSALVKAFTL